MVTLLSRIFIKNPESMTLPDRREAYGVLCGALGIFLNVLLFAGKFLAGTISGSIAITADAFNNLSDAGSSLVTMVGFRLAGQKPDSEHPFGHGRMEYISGFVVAIAILMMAFELLKSSVGKIVHPQSITSDALIIAILAASIFVKLYMVTYNRRFGRKLESAAMRATAADSMSDSIATTAVLAATLVSKYTGLNIDGWVGVLVGAFVLWTGIKAARDTISPLLGQPPSREFVAQVVRIVNSHDNIAGVHDLIVHDYGPGRVMVSLHAEVPADGDILELHDTIDHIENEISEKLNCQAVIHMDPIVTDDVHVGEVRGEILKIVKSVDSQLTMHDFRMIEGPTHTNVVFDVVVPMGYHMTGQEVMKTIQKKIHDWNNTYNAVIHIDESYI